MKRLFTTVLSILLFACHSWGQTTVSIGLPVTGAGSTNVLLSTSTTGNLWSKTISIYTAAEIVGGGGSAGNIISLAWDKQGTGEYQFGNATMIVYLKHVTNSSWGTVPDFAIEAATATQVFNSTTYSLPVGVGWAPLTFTTPFAWNGTDNIAVLVDWYRPSTPTAAINWGRSTATDANATRVGSTPSLPALLINSNRPVIQLVFGTGPSCAAPTGLAATGVTSTGATLNWNAVTGATGYEYAFSASATPPASGTSTTATTHNPGTLTPSTTYYMHVRTQCGAAFSGWTTISFTTTAAPCAAPSTPVISGITQTSANANWTAVTGAVGYEYAVTTTTTPPANGTGIMSTSQPLISLSAGTTYYLHIRTNCGGSNFSNWVTTSFTTAFPPCVPPVPVASNITSATADINWPAVIGATGYEYDVSTNSIPPTNGTGTTATSYNAISLTPATTYYAHIRTACPGSQFSPWVTVNFTTFSPCNSPSPTATGITASSVDIGWSAITGANGYEFDVNTSATPPATGTPTTLLSQTVGSLTAGTNYYLHVRTDCGSGNFSQWASIPFTTVASCGAPIATISNITESGADISWGAVTGATGYEYAVNTNAAPPTGAGTPTSALTYSPGSLTPATAYYVHLRSICNAIQSTWSTSSFFTQFPAGINNKDTDNAVNIYPNPAKDQITIQANGKIKEIRLYSAVGGLIMIQPVDNNKETIDISEFAAGIYHMRLQTENGPVNRQISIVR